MAANKSGRNGAVEGLKGSEDSLYEESEVLLIVHCSDVYCSLNWMGNDTLDLQEVVEL